MSGHTKGKLRTVPAWGRSVDFIDYDDCARIALGMRAYETPVCLVLVAYPKDRAKCEANAARLALCWNEHDALVDGLRSLFRWAGHQLGFDKSEWADISALLARVRQEKKEG